METVHPTQPGERPRLAGWLPGNPAHANRTPGLTGRETRNSPGPDSGPSGLTELGPGVPPSGDVARCTNRCSARGPPPVPGCMQRPARTRPNEEVLTGEDG